MKEQVTEEELMRFVRLKILHDQLKSELTHCKQLVAEFESKPRNCCQQVMINDYKTFILQIESIFSFAGLK